MTAVTRHHGWTHVVMVTSRYHVPRARLYLRRAVDGYGIHVDVHAALRNHSLWKAARRLTHEGLGLLEAVARRRVLAPGYSPES
jgi:uncharacterized SAM-binding protein YcdF (DUF218 family)